jgi:hypothetical protein
MTFEHIPEVSTQIGRAILVHDTKTLITTANAGTFSELVLAPMRAGTFREVEAILPSVITGNNRTFDYWYLYARVCFMIGMRDASFREKSRNTFRQLRKQDKTRSELHGLFLQVLHAEEGSWSDDHAEYYLACSGTQRRRGGIRTQR